jgi:hypothetical protein
VTPQAQNIGTTGLHTDDEYYNQACHAKKGDFEFFAEIDVLLCALDLPRRDLSIPQYGPDARDQLEVCRRWRGGVRAGSRFARRLDSTEPAPYRGFHGLRIHNGARLTCTNFATSSTADGGLCRVATIGTFLDP